MIHKAFFLLESSSVWKLILGLALLLDFSVYVLNDARHMDELECILLLQV